MKYSPFYHIGSAFWKRNPIQLTFFLTRRCNAGCPFCFYISDKNDSGSILSELTIEEIKKVSASIGKLLWLAFSGGEIFLRNDLVKITRIFYENNKPSIILLPTNGLLPDAIKEMSEEILKRCKNSIVVLKLSLDGTEDLHDSLRGVKGAFKKTIETYERLGGLLDKYENFELGVNTVFCSANQDNMDEIIESVNRLDRVKTHTVSLIRGEVSDITLKKVSIDKYLETVKKIEGNLKKRTTGIYRFKGARLKAAQDILQRRLIYETLLRIRRMTPCYAGKLTLVLTEAGDVYPCESFTNKIGNVRESGYDIKRILKSEKARNVVNSINNNGCYCTHECYFMMNILFNPLLYPSLIKEYFQL